MLAIIIPYYKITFFEETLKSLSNQTDKRFKVYIGDDAGPENPSFLLEKYKGKFDFIYHRFNENLGGTSLTEQWERSIALSGTEEWIMILGDDDVLEPNIVSSFNENLNIIKENNIQLVRFASRVINEENKYLSLDFKHPLFENVEDSFYRKFKSLSRGSLSEHIFSRKTYEKYHFFHYPLAWHSDDRAWLDFSDKFPIFSINKAFVNVRISCQSISGNSSYKEIKIKATFNFFSDLLQNPHFWFTRKQKAEFLLYLGILLKDQKSKSVQKVLSITIKLVKNGSVYDALRFIRRMYFLNDKCYGNRFNKFRVMVTSFFILRLNS